MITAPLNSSLGNEAWDDKRTRIKKSLLMLNKDIAEKEQGTENDIKERSEVLFNSFINIWAFQKISKIEDEDRKAISG